MEQQHQAPSPCKQSNEILPKRLLVIGSSVCTGSGASQPGKRGWTSRLRNAIKPYGVEYVNEGRSGTTVSCWLPQVSGSLDFAAKLHKFGVVILSLSLGNEGLPYASSLEEIAAIEQSYTEGLLKLVQRLRARMLPGARL